jgi:H+/gluconate symporter-like permease
MTVLAARKFIISASLVSTAATFAFLIVAKPLGFPIDWPQVTRIVEIVLPVFLGYLGTASHFLFRNAGVEDHVQLGEKEALLGTLVKGPIWVFSALIVVVFFSFGYSNRQDAPRNSGMSVDTLAWSITVCLGILTASTSVAVNFLFSVAGNKNTSRPSRSSPRI